MRKLKKVYLEISNVCNLSCAFCPGTARKPHFMTAEEFTLCAGKLRGVTEYIYFHLMGEPLLHPSLESFLNIACEMGFKVIITTNGTLLKKCGDKLLSSEAVHKVNISLQSFEANDGGELEEYIASCADFAHKMSERGKLCVLRLWNRNGLDGLNIEIEKLLENTFPKPWKKSRQSLLLAEKVYLEGGEKFDWPDMETDEIGESVFCYGLRDQIGVLCDGTVVPCCLDRNGDIPLGNLFTDDIDTILDSNRAKAIYDGFSNRNAVEPLCRRCGYAGRFSKKRSVPM